MRSPDDARAALRALAETTKPKPPAGRKARRDGEPQDARAAPSEAPAARRPV